MYWKCCEERFCFDKKIATYKLEEESYANGYTNMGASVDSVVTVQPLNNNHLPPQAITGREINEVPLHADKLYEVFSKSLIFRDDHELKSKSQDSLDDLETKSEPDYLSDKPNRTKVYFEDEVDSPVTDFEIMFKDELLAHHDMFKIEEEEEEDRRSNGTEKGLTMNVSLKKQDVIKPSTVTIKDESKITIPNPTYNYDPISVVTLPSTLSLPRVENVKGILRQRGELPRSNSARTLERIDSNRPGLNGVESLKHIDPNKINKVLARMPHRSASFLNIPEHLAPEKPPLLKSKSMVGVMSEEIKLSKLLDTPIIKSNNLPRFFTDKPIIITDYNRETLQSIKQKSALMYKENDFSMPRYYGTVSKSTENLSLNESKSMPDLRNPASTGKVSKRLIKLRGRLKPLVIRKSSDEKL
ncbi:Bud site selection protein 3 [Operophtera brumata]|uniref:Bud site selection protein 3 n=1 Tax=Operophtera brumata TaxID=104452 RepID=A0A0L7LBS3_OPEBR|nr:Bud site selection protein 3 [Operophtera brumata]